MTDQRSTRLGLDWALVGLDGAGFGLGLAHHVACYDKATSRPWASTGPWSTARGLRWTHAPVYGGPLLLLVNRVHLSPHLSVVYVHRVYEWAVQGRKFSPLLQAVCSRRWRTSPMSLAGGVGVRSSGATASLRCGDSNGGAIAAAKVPQGSGNGDGCSSSSAYGDGAMAAAKPDHVVHVSITVLQQAHRAGQGDL